MTGFDKYVSQFCAASPSEEVKSFGEIYRKFVAIGNKPSQ